MIYDERSKLVLWDYILNKKSVAAVKQAMKDNLNGTKKELIKTFSYSIGEEYTQKVIGEGYSGTEKYDLLIDLVGKNIKDAETWASNHNLALEIEYVTDTKYANNVVAEQEYPVSKRIDLIPDKTMKVKVSKNEEENTQDAVDCLEDVDNEVCILQDFTGKTKNDFIKWAKNFSNKVKYSTSQTKESDKPEGTILEQSEPKGTKVKDLIDNDITIVFTLAEKKKTETPEETEQPTQEEQEETPQEQQEEANQEQNP